MANIISTNLKKVWNIFSDSPKDEAPLESFSSSGMSYSYRPDRPVITRGNEKTILSSIITRIAIDVSAIPIKHVRLDEEGRYLEEVDSSLNGCLTLSANIDQTGRSLILDAVISMLDEGTVAIAPIDTNVNPDTGSFDIESLRVCKILEWYPTKIKMRAYNDKTGVEQDFFMDKTKVVIIENPYYSVMNATNSTMRRLIRKLALLDAIDEQSSSGKLDLIIQLPYVVRSEARQKQAENRRKAIEDQLSGTKYGIAYTDGTEKITQLNRPVENNLMSQIEYLTTQLYSQLGFHLSILEGTADEKTSLNYNNKIIEPILSTITTEMKRKWLTKTARTQKQSIEFFRDPFKLVPVENLAEIVDKFTRNEILTSNEVRQILGFKPSADPKANELRNKNLSEPVDKQNTIDKKEEPVSNEEE